jgi:integrase
LAPKTIINIHRMLHRALRDAVRWDMTPRNAAQGAQPPRSRRPKVTVWEPEQMRRFVDQVRDDRFFAMWLLAATTGMRRGELAGLLVSDLDLRHASRRQESAKSPASNRRVGSAKTPTHEAGGPMIQTGGSHGV